MKIISAKKKIIFCGFPAPKTHFEFSKSQQYKQIDSKKQRATFHDTNICQSAKVERISMNFVSVLPLIRYRTRVKNCS